MKPPTISYLTSIWFEPGIAASAPDLLISLNITRPLIVTDPGVIAAGLLDRLNLTSSIIFDAVDPNPTEANATAGRDHFLVHDCDGIIAIGGGSPIDCAKAISLLVTHDAPLEQYVFASGGLPRITADKPPVIAVPTTAGTGSEVGRAALITFTRGVKLGLLSPHLIPTAVLCDPTLTLGLPPILTAATGMDAISHCVETYCSPRFNPIADAIALDGFKRACVHLPHAVTDGSNLAARSEMMMAALQGGMTFQKGLGAIHSLSHPLGALTTKKLHHGTLNAIFLPHVLRFNLAACPERIDALALAAGLQRGDQHADWFSYWIANLGLPTRLSELGLSHTEVLPLASAAHLDHCSATNPRPLSAADCANLYEFTV